MKLSHLFPVLLLAGTITVASACNKFIVEQVNYAQPIESVLEPNEKGVVQDLRYGITFNIKPFEQKELGDQDSLKIDNVRLIRNAQGLYFITANNFRHVYVMQPVESALELKKKIRISEERLVAPAFNLRDGEVQLVKTEVNEVISLSDEENQNERKEKKS
jgi:hypothetical protein